MSSEYAIETFGGRFVDTYHPDPKTISLFDIAHALSMTCRYGGHCAKFYSVAEHAVLVSRRLEQKGHHLTTCLAGLHHDDAEAYLVDIPRPTKPLLGIAYEVLTDRMDSAIVAGLDLPFTARMFHDEAVKAADDWVLFVEARDLLPSKGKDWPGPSRLVIPDYWTGGIHHDAAKSAFLDRHYELIGENR